MRWVIPIGFLVIAAGFSAVVMLLWNWLIPAIFGLSVINFWQAAGILAFCRILFGSFSSRYHGAGNGGMRHAKNHLREKWMNMTSEERKEFFSQNREWVNKVRERFSESEFRGKPDFDAIFADEKTPQNND